jgi:hypothetical protein
MKPLERMTNIDGASVDLLKSGPHSLGTLAVIIGGKEELNQRLKKSFAPPGGEWFTASLPNILKELADIRNPSAHSAPLDRETLRSFRNRYLGVGCEGELVKLSKIRVI